MANGGFAVGTIVLQLFFLGEQAELPNTLHPVLE
jgi:hypothetical protein